MNHMSVISCFMARNENGGISVS